MSNEELIKQLEQATQEIEVLRGRVSRLEDRETNVKVPKTMILDDSFIKRALAVYGHVLVAGIIIAIPFYCLFFLLGILGG